MLDDLIINAKLEVTEERIIERLEGEIKQAQASKHSNSRLNREIIEIHKQYLEFWRNTYPRIRARMYANAGRKTD